MHRALTNLTGPVDRAALIEAAGRLDLDAEAFAADLDAPRTEARLDEDRILAEDAGHSDGPLLFIDGRLYTGAVDEAALSEALERPLGLRLRDAGSDFFGWAAAGGLVLVLATLAALVVANFTVAPRLRTLYARRSCPSAGTTPASA